MKVILMQKIERLGEPGQQVDVADGYARNFLLPKQLAVPATPGHLKALAQLKAQSRNREEHAVQEATNLAERLAAVAISLTRRASSEAPAAVAPAAGVKAESPAAESPVVPAPAPTAQAPESAEAAAPAFQPAGRLFGSVTSQDISEALEAHGIPVDKKKILLPEPIKTLGVHRVPVRLHADVVAEVSVTVIPQV
jgi:large subunit ribosomal protein L9